MPDRGRSTQKFSGASGYHVKSPAVLVAKILARFTEQGPQRHFRLIKKEIELDYIKFINANDAERQAVPFDAQRIALGETLARLMANAQD